MNNVLLSSEEYDFVWASLMKKLNAEERKISEFYCKISFPFDVYSVKSYADEEIGKINRCGLNALKKVTSEGELVYTLDWQHDCRLFDPRNCETMQDFSYTAGGCDFNYYFPDFVPDGDYYFFVAKDMRFGWLGHPWKQWIFVFGEDFRRAVANEVKNTCLERIDYRKDMYENFGKICTKPIDKSTI